MVLNSGGLEALSFCVSKRLLTIRNGESMEHSLKFKYVKSGGE